MHSLKSVGFRLVVLSLATASSAYAATSLPPPPEASPETSAAMDSALDATVPPGADGLTATTPLPAEEPEVKLPATLPEAPAPENDIATAPAPDSDVANAPAPEAESDLPPAPAPDEDLANAPSDTPSADTPPDSFSSAPPPEEVAEAPRAPRMTTHAEFEDLSMEDKLKSKDLSLWLWAGPTYGQVSTKGTYSGTNLGTVGGVSGTAGFGVALASLFQLDLTYVGTPRTENSAVESYMFGMGPRLGFLSFEGLFGVQAGPDMTPGSGGFRANRLAYGLKGGMDIVFKHFEDSRISLGIAPEAFWVTAQGANGYTQTGIGVGLRIYGYDNAF